jgi:hypothetical protein
LLKTIVKQHSELRWPSDSISLGLLTPIESRDELFLVDMRMIVSHYWETIFRHGGDSNAVLPSWSESDKHARCLPRCLVTTATSDRDRDFAKPSSAASES